MVVDGNDVDIRDQRPLYLGKTKLERGRSFGDLVRALNERIYFWPGTDDQPSSYGIRHFERYEGSEIVIFRMRTEDLFHVNSKESPYFCKFNSGSPRTTQGKGSPRDPNTFVDCTSAAYSACGVVEVTYAKVVNLPLNIESAKSPWGPWKKHRLT